MSIRYSYSGEQTIFSNELVVGPMTVALPKDPILPVLQSNSAVGTQLM